jgi:hypothetical protein
MLLTRRVSVTRLLFFPVFFQLIFGSVFCTDFGVPWTTFCSRKPVCDLTCDCIYILLLSALRLQLFYTQKQQKLGLLQEFGS